MTDHLCPHCAEYMDSVSLIIRERERISDWLSQRGMPTAGTRIRCGAHWVVPGIPTEGPEQASEWTISNERAVTRDCIDRVFGRQPKYGRPSMQCECAGCYEGSGCESDRLIAELEQAWEDTAPH